MHARAGSVLEVTAVVEALLGPDKIKTSTWFSLDVLTRHQVLIRRFQIGTNDAGCIEGKGRFSANNRDRPRGPRDRSDSPTLIGRTRIGSHFFFMIPPPWIAARSGSLVGGNPPTDRFAKNNEVCARPSKRGHIASEPRHLPSHTTDNPATDGFIA